MNLPEVSVVMGVYNGAEHLEQTLASILSQDACDLEFIVVNDGSTDGTGHIMDKWAERDGRLRVIHQQNTGLTRALIKGCAEARGQYIARQDAGDISLPGRLRKQAMRLNVDPELVAVSCDCAFVGPRSELLYCTLVREDDLNKRLLATVEEALAGPAHHGSVMMRRDTYQVVGGYRADFYFAQDLDLWSRLAERGRFAICQETLYRARLDPKSITGTHAFEQRELTKLIAAAAAARRMGRPEDSILAKAAAIGPVARGNLQRRLASGNYFIGSCLRKSDPKASAEYFRAAIKHDSTHWWAWLRLAESKVRRLL